MLNSVVVADVASAEAPADVADVDAVAVAAADDCAAVLMLLLRLLRLRCFAVATVACGYVRRAYACNVRFRFFYCCACWAGIQFVLFRVKL